MKTVLRRLQLEQHRSESLAASDNTGARERLMERLNSMSDRLRGDPNWEALPKPTVEEVRQRLQEALARHRGDGG